MITFTDEQQAALDRIAAWLDNTELGLPQPTFLLDGGAGTGKTTIAAEVEHRSRDTVIQYAAFTAKAARVMEQKGMDGARTLHSLLYWPERRDGKLTWVKQREASPLASTDLLIIDECSMVSDLMYEDILEYEVPTLVLGDVDGQLPPIRGTGAFHSRPPDARLLEPHRAAMESEINRIAWLARRGGRLPRIRGPEVTIASMMDPSAWDHILDGDSTVIVGKHKTRFAVTRRAREKAGFKGPLPCPGEPVICCRNNYDQGLINGDVATVWRCRATRGLLEADLLLPEGQRTVFLRPEGFQATAVGATVDYETLPREGAIFDWAYAITCHKAQGSEWDNVVVIDDQLMHWDRDFRRRWLYTALTRAAQRLVVLETTR
jgi:exodeoxyribonuclease-5